MMMAWKVSGLSQSPAIIASRPASMRLAMAISPSRDRSSTEPISRRYMRTGSSVRSVGSLSVVVTTALGAAAFDEVAAFGFLFLGAFGRRLGFVGVFRLDDIDAHLVEHRVDVFDLLGGHFLRRQNGVELVMRHKPALLRELDHPLDGGIGQIEQRAVAAVSFDRRGLVFALVFDPFSPSSAPSGRRLAAAPS